MDIVYEDNKLMKLYVGFGYFNLPRIYFLPYWLHCTVPIAVGHPWKDVADTDSDCSCLNNLGLELPFHQTTF